MPTQREIEAGVLIPSQQAELARQKDARAAQAAKLQNDAALSQLLQGKQADQGNEMAKLGKQEEYRQKHVTEVIPRLKEMQQQFPNMAPSLDETGNVSLHPIDTLDKELKRSQMGALAEDRQDRIKGRETNNIQNYYSSQGGKNYAQKAAILQRARELFDKGDPESLRSAELELSQGQAANALTQQEYNALTSAHGAGNMAQSAMKGAGQVIQNIPGLGWLGEKLGQKASEYKTMTPAEIKQKRDVAQHLIDQNRSSADSIRGELNQRSQQLAPSMTRHDPQGLRNVVETLGARIPAPSEPDVQNRSLPQADSQTKTVGRKTYIKSSQGWVEQ